VCACALGLLHEFSVAGAYDLNTLSWGNLWTPMAGEPSTGFTPMQNIGPSTKPILIIHSDDDKSVPIQQAIDMDRALTEAKVYHKFIHYTDRGPPGFHG
jgi:hypothetical protein